MHVRRMLPRVLAALIVLWIALPAWAVDLNSTIKGVVSDNDGLPIPGVQMLLTSPDMLGDRTTETDADGRYRFTVLPPGLYTVSATRKGFEDWTSAELKLSVAVTAQLDIELFVEGSAHMEIEVVEAAPAVDTEAVFSGAVLDAEFLKDIPTGRNYQSATALAPGVVGGGNANVRGGFYSSNQFYVDGVNITDPMTNTFSTNMNFDTIDSLQILTGAMDAEYGRALGGAINIVTKSGGNTFEGQANLIYHQGPAMTLAPPIEEFGDRFDTSLEEQLAVSLGGPIKKDKVWFFTSLQGDRAVYSLSFDNDTVGRDLDKFPMSPENWRSIYWFAKVTAQPTTEHRLWLQLQGDPTWIDNIFQDPYTLPSGEAVQNQGGWLGSLGHTYTPTNWLILETQLYHQTSYIDFFSILWNNCQEFDDTGDCAHRFEGMQYGNEVVPDTILGAGLGDFSAGEFPYAYYTQRPRNSLNSSLTILGDLLGEHRAKIGIQAELLATHEVYPGSDRGDSYWSYDPSLDPDGLGPTNMDAYVPNVVYVYDSDWDVHFTGNLFSTYVQDVYKPHRRLTLRPGLRMDYAVMKNEDDLTTKAIETPEAVFKRATLAPRMGIAYDLTGDGKTRVHGYYGRFYDSGFLTLSSLLRRTSQGYSEVPWDPEAGAWDYDNPSFSVADQFLAHDDLRNPYSDEFDIGVAREVGPGLALGITGTYEESRRFWEDDEVNLIWNDEGTQIIGGRNGSNDAVYRLRTPDDTFTRYTSVELTLAKQYTDNWGLEGSYTWSRAYGTNSFDQASASADIAQQRQYEIGFLDYDRTHQVKAAGSYSERNVTRVGTTKLGYVFGWNYQLHSGEPMHPFYSDAAYDLYTGPADGRLRLPAYSKTDVRTGLTLDFDDRIFWMLGVDVFNLFNDRVPTGMYAELPTLDATDPVFTVTSIQQPRSMQLSIRAEF